MTGYADDAHGKARDAAAQAQEGAYATKDKAHEKLSQAGEAASAAYNQVTIPAAHSFLYITVLVWQALPAGHAPCMQHLGSNPRPASACITLIELEAGKCM